MAIADVIHDPEGRSGGVDRDAVRTLGEEFTVTTTDPADGVPAVIDGLILWNTGQFAWVALYQPHPDYPRALSTGATAKAVGKSGKVWRVTVGFSSAAFPARGDGGLTVSGLDAPAITSDTTPNVSQSNQTPANERPPVVNITRKEITVPLEKDAVTGDRVVNKVGDPFIPAPEVFRSHELITFEFHRKPADLNWPARSAFKDKINSNAPVILGKTYPAHSLRVIDYSESTVWDQGATGLELFFKLTVQLEYKPDLWKISLLNTGRRGRPAGAALTDPIVILHDENGQPVADPVPLDLNGYPVVAGAYEYVNVDGYQIVDFSTSPGLLA